MGKCALIFPGQGAQVPKMGLDFYDSYAVAREVFEQAEELLKMHLKKLIFEGDVATLTLTKNCQPAIFVTSIAILRVVEQEFPDLKVSICGGLSLGEYSALVASKKARFSDVVSLVCSRGMAMQQAAERYLGTMAAVFGLEAEKIVEAGYHVANINSPGQVVIAGTIADIEKAEGELKELGAKRVVRFNVAGAFHSPLMREAQEKLAPAIEALPLFKSQINLVMNVVGKVVSEADQIKRYLIEQVSSTTKWVDCVHAMEEKNPTCYLELGPAQLAGMNKKIGVKSPTISVQCVRDLESIDEASTR